MEPKKGKKTLVYGSQTGPRLSWEGKIETTSFRPPIASLLVYERINPASIIETVRKQETRGQGEKSLLEFLDGSSPQRDPIESYRHENSWSNRLIDGDSLLVMNSLLEKEGLARQVQMIYFDPPYGIKYSSSFRPFVNKKGTITTENVDKTQEKKLVQAYQDTWELGLDSYLNHLWKRFLLARELLSESGSIFVQISDENVHLVRLLMDEVFGSENFIAEIRYQCRTTEYTRFIPTLTDNLLWYGKDKARTKYHQLFYERPVEKVRKTFNYVELADGAVRPLTKEEKEGLKPLPDGSKLFKAAQLSQKSSEQVERVVQAGRSVKIGQKLYYKRYADDFPLLKHTNHWTDTVWSTFSTGKVYAVQTHATTVTRCLLMTTDPGDLVFDPTCGSGTTAFVAEQWGRRWITCDTSRVAISTAKQRLLTAVFDYYELVDPKKGVTGGFRYRTVPHVTLGTVSRNKRPAEEVLYDQPLVGRSMARISSPFTVETVVAPASVRQVEWCNELLRTGILGKEGERIIFERVIPLFGFQWLHAEAEMKGNGQQRVLVSFGPDRAPLEQEQVESAVNETKKLDQPPNVIVFAAFHCSPLASKLIGENSQSSITLLKVQMNTDMVMEDLKKGASDENFWLVGNPEVVIEQVSGGKDKRRQRVEVLGLNYYSPESGEAKTSGSDRIVMWMLDPDYDGKVLVPRQVFIPAGNPLDWSNLEKNLKVEIDEKLASAYKGLKSLDFDTGANNCIAVKIVDDRGLESLKIINV